MVPYIGLPVVRKLWYEVFGTLGMDVTTVPLMSGLVHALESCY